MKKLGVVLLAVLLCISVLTACGEEASFSSENSSTSASTENPSRKNEGGMNENLWKLLSAEMARQERLSEQTGPFKYSETEPQFLELAYEESKTKDDLRTYLIDGDDYFIPNAEDYRIGYFRLADYYKSAGGDCYVARIAQTETISEEAREFLEETLWQTARETPPGGSGTYVIDDVPKPLALVRFGAFSKAARNGNPNYTRDYCDYVVSFVVMHQKPQLTGLEQNVSIKGKSGKLEISYLSIGYAEGLPKTKIGNYYLTFEYEEKEILYTVSVGLGYLCEELSGERKTAFEAEIFTYGETIMESILSKIL